MSDSSYIKVASRFIPVETVDEGWSGESLSDDEVDLPKDHLSNAAMEDLEEEEDDDGFLPSREIDSFNDLGLDRFVANLETEAVSPSSSSAFAQAMLSAQRALNEERERGNVPANTSMGDGDTQGNQD